MKCCVHMKNLYLKISDTFSAILALSIKKILFGIHVETYIYTFQ